MALHEEGPGLQAVHSPSSSAAVSQSPWEDLSLSDSIAPLQESSHADPLRPSSSAGKVPALMRASHCLTCLLDTTGDDPLPVLVHVPRLADQFSKTRCLFPALCCTVEGNSVSHR